MSSILTNNGAMVALQTLKGINKNMGMIQSEISTGKSVGTAKDNAAVWAISKVMESDVKGFKGISDSLNLGSSTLTVGRQAAESVTDLLTDIKGKIVAAQEENVDRAKIQTDIVALREQIASVVGAAQFNGLNLITGTDDVNILSSLDRASNGNVTASNITIQREDLTTTAGTFGTGASLAPNAIASAATTASVGKTAELSFGGTWAVNDTARVTVGGVELNYTAATTSATDAAAFFTGAINALGLTGVSASNAAGVLTISSTRAFEGLSVAQSETGAANTVAITNVNGAAPSGTNTATSSVISQRAEKVNLSTTASVNEGDSYKVTIGAASFDYIAGKGETMEDVARGLKVAIDSGNPNGVTTSVTQDATTKQWSLNIDNDGTGSASLSLASTGNAGGKASGGLFGLDSIDVRSNKGADSALSNIETMISRSIEAAANFGSTQKRIGIQSEFVGKLSDALKSGIGSLVDADMEEASARLQALQVQQQLGTQSLSIANQQPQSLLALFR
ncbi:MAG: flagellin [Paracoccaceae bacterium]